MKMTLLPVVVAFAVISFGKTATSAAAAAAAAAATTDTELHLTTTDEGFLTVIQGFAAQLHCRLNACSDKVSWYKDGVLIFNATNFNALSSFSNTSYALQHDVQVNNSGCLGSCSDSSSCSDGHSCVKNTCCPCTSEEFTLVLRNLTFDDAGRYKCQLEGTPDLLEFQVDVLESGLKGGFHANISYDHSECCSKRNISSLCRAMCKPSEMAQHYFDPTSCRTDDYKAFLQCATDDGRRSHVHCCQTQLVPSFCYDFCSGDFKMLRRSHRLCLYYLPEIFECYNRAYLLLTAFGEKVGAKQFLIFDDEKNPGPNIPYPDAPEQLSVSAMGASELRACWKPPPPQPSNKHLTVTHYTVAYKQVPSFPFLGGLDESLPLLTGDYVESGSPSADDGSEGGTSPAPLDYDVDHREVAPDGRTTAEVRRTKRQTWVFVTHDSETNSSSVREFKFQKLNVSETCATIRDLRAATRYIVYVTAHNDYGESIPSVRAVASTDVLPRAPAGSGAVPDTLKTLRLQYTECCKDNKVSDYCANKMCDVATPPNPLEVISISTTCREYWPKVSPCVADGRDHTACCERKGVQADCLKICSGAAETLPMHSILCLNLDLPAIYQCLYEGYANHPSAPTNVTLLKVGKDWATVSWAEPIANAHLVSNYSLFIAPARQRENVIEVTGVKSPHTEFGLKPDTEYELFVQSKSAQAGGGQSLPSTTLDFFTKDATNRGCRHGSPLLSPGAQSSSDLIICSESDSDGACPAAYFCEPEPDANDQRYCCPKAKPTPSNETAAAGALDGDAELQACCRDMQMSEECAKSCSWNQTLPVSCQQYLTSWTRCASEAADHSRCCEQRGVRADCLSGCRHPFELEASCADQTEPLLMCYASRHGELPLPITGLEVVSVEARQAFISWDGSRRPVDAWRVELVAAQGGSPRIFNATVSSVDLSDLQPKTLYSVRVTALNNHGEGPTSLPLDFVTLSAEEEAASATPGKPFAPTGFHVVTNYGKWVNVSWSPVEKLLSKAPITGPVSYEVELERVDTNETKWSTHRTNATWLPFEGLTLDAKYSAHVSAIVDGRKSAPSATVRFFAQADSFALDEPKIEAQPETPASGYYAAGQTINVTCRAEVVGKHTIELSVGSQSVRNDADPSARAVSMPVTLSEGDAVRAECAVSDVKGRQNVAIRRFLVNAPPTVSFIQPEFKAAAGLPVELHCLAGGYPAPSVWFERKDGQRLEDANVRVQQLEENQFNYVLTIDAPNVKSDAGDYSCVAEGPGKGEKNETARATAKLDVFEDKLPVSPRLVLQCCEDAKVDDSCLAPCAIGSVVGAKAANCSRYANSYVGCMKDDTADRSQCCKGSGVPDRCLAVCSGDSLPSGCDAWAQHALACFVRGHEKAPRQPSALGISTVNQTHTELTWRRGNNEGNGSAAGLEYFVVYWKPLDDESEYQQLRTLEPHAVLAMNRAAVYDVAVASANQFGHSAFTFAKLRFGKPGQSPSSADGKSGGGSGIWGWLLALLLIGLLAGLGVVWWRRQSANGRSPFSSLSPSSRTSGFSSSHGDAGSRPDPSVAFENPGFAGEVEIRGLRGGGWQAADLEPADGVGNLQTNSPTPRVGRYEKLQG